MKTTEQGVIPSSELFFTSPSNQAKNLFYYVTCTGHYKYEDSYTLRRENYNSYLILHILKGSVKIEHDNLSYAAKMGETVLINCHKPHSYSSLGDLDTLWFHFDGINAAAIYEELSMLYHGSVILRNSGDIVNRINGIYQIYQSGKKISEAVQSAYIARILGEFFRGAGNVTPEEDNVIDTVVTYIEENYDKELAIPDLAELAGLSEYYFSRKFKKQTGFTIHEYILKTRVNSAKMLLKSSGLSLREIAYQCGFSNESSFSNTFKKIAGMTPGSFRATNI